MKKGMEQCLQNQPHTCSAKFLLTLMQTLMRGSMCLVKLLRTAFLLWCEIILLLGNKGLWIKVPIYLVNLVEALVKEGFGYHHAEPKDLMLVYWIPESPSTIPANATHRYELWAMSAAEMSSSPLNSGTTLQIGQTQFQLPFLSISQLACLASIPPNAGSSDEFPVANLDLLLELSTL
ncbi:hypothetical protein VNO77_03040 [Canavalia gladiata]|uniref:Pre-nudix hydrolase domain-containing protein n=1 Tax=Canavalia gladiata TaxID=3824 RepID=A0AAN9MW33_CANGL